MYFLQVSGVPMRYTFDLYHYGPFCDRVSRDVERLTADAVLKDTSAEPNKYSNYRPDRSAEELILAHPKLADYDPTLRAVVRTLLPLKPDRLELLATLDYLYRQMKAGGGGGPWKDRVVERFVEVKKDKFPRPQVSDAYDAMVKARLVGE